LWRSPDRVASARRMGRGPMEISDEGERDANVVFWQRQFERFLYAATETEAVSALTDALRSDAAMPNIFRLVLADMLEGGSVRLSEESWTIRAVRRRDADITKIKLPAWKRYREVQALINDRMSKTGACKEVARRHNKDQRAIEISYNKHAALMRQLVEEPRKRAEAAMQRSKALRQTLRYGSRPEDDQGS
jgi:hypothetical protein